jgi:hypothetical protein
MKLRYGSYTHELAEASIAITRQPQLNDAGVPCAYTERWEIRGDVRPSTVTQAAITTAIRALEAAYSVNGRDLVLLQDDGAVSAHRMISSQSIGGVRIVGPPGYSESNNGQYAWGRSYQITAEADFAILTPGAAIVSWSESLEFRGGGPRYVTQEFRNGPPLRTLVSQYTPYFAAQSGSAVGYFSTPNFPGPIWPGAEDQPNRSIRYDAPKAVGNGAALRYTNYGVSWSYSFTSSSALGGSPNARPRF